MKQSANTTLYRKGLQLPQIREVKKLALKWQRGQPSGAREVGEQRAACGALHQKGRRVSEIEKHYIECLNARALFPSPTTTTVLIRAIYTRKISHGLHKPFQALAYIRRKHLYECGLYLNKTRISRINGSRLIRD